MPRMTQSSSALAWLDAELAQLETDQLRRRLRTRHTAQGPEIEIDGRVLVNFASNDYLALADDTAIVEAVREAATPCGFGSGASPLVVGRDATHAKLEAALAEFEGVEAALLFPSGFAANSGAIPALTSSGDVILSDAKNHASLVDGCRLSNAATHIYRHTDVDHLESLLKQNTDARRRLIATDSLFSMDGDLAPLDRIAELAEQYNAMLLVDEAHATGVFGARGRGVAEHFGVDDRVDVRIGTLSKALGGAGGFVSGSQSLIDWLANRARSYVFSTASPAVLASAALAALRKVKEDPQRRTELLSHAAALRATLSEQGWQLGTSASQIIPIYIGDPDAAVELSAKLATKGFLVPAIRPPSVPPGESLLRLSLRWDHTPAMLDSFVTALAELKQG